VNINSPTAYMTDDPAAVAAFLAACAAQAEFARNVHAAAAAVGKNIGAMRAKSVFGNDETVGLGTDTPDDRPAGWVYSKSKGYLVPGRGKAGDAARAWLKAHQPPEDIYTWTVLAGFGLPANDMLGTTSAGFRMGRPSVAYHDDKLWALYLGTPGLWCESNPKPVTWTPCKVSEFYIALEASKEAAATARAADTSAGQEVPSA
jgi:hypothetical protein